MVGWLGRGVVGVKFVLGGGGAGRQDVKKGFGIIWGERMGWGCLGTVAGGGGGLGKVGGGGWGTVGGWWGGGRGV